MKKGQIFQKESTLYGNSFYEKQDGRSYSSAQLVYIVQFHMHITHWRLAKRIGNLNSFFEKADSPPPPEKAVDSQNVSVSAPNIITRGNTW